MVLIVLTDEQQKAVENVETYHISIITGGAGTGKTTTIKEIVSRFKENGCSVALCAPTGKAAKRMSEAIGDGAKGMTIHRLLEYMPESGEFLFNAENPLEDDVVVVDEASMLDVSLTYHLMQAISIDTKVVFVGDDNQLPPVGLGYVFRDMIDSGSVPVSRLSVIQRQDDKYGGIVINSHLVNTGYLPDNNEFPDFQWIQTNSSDEICSYIDSDLISKDTFILSPMKKKGVSVSSLNERLKKRFNPSAMKPLRIGFGTTVHVGDPVMQMKNNYQLNIFNGFTGIVTNINFDDPQSIVTVEFDGEPYVYDSEQISELSLSYATTIHKSQGSEWDEIAIVLDSSHHIMLQRNLLYTAITRAKKKCYLFASEKSVQQAVSNIMPRLRKTRLIELLKGNSNVR